MSELVKFEVKRLPDLRVAGKELRHNMQALMKGDNPIPAFWGKCFSEGVFAPLEQQADVVYDAAYIGFMTDWGRGDGDFSYIVGMLMKAGAEVPEGYCFRDIATTDAAVGWVKGSSVADVCARAHVQTEQALKENGRKCDTMTWCMELYNCPRFTTPDANGDIILDYYIPVD